MELPPQPLSNNIVSTLFYYLEPEAARLDGAQEPVGLMGNLLRGREAVQNTPIYRYIVATRRLNIMPCCPRFPTCLLRSSQVRQTPSQSRNCWAQK